MEPTTDTMLGPPAIAAGASRFRSRAIALTFTKTSMWQSRCCWKILLVVPTRYDLVLSKSICCRGRYGWKNESCRERSGVNPCLSQTRRQREPKDEPFQRRRVADRGTGSSCICRSCAGWKVSSAASLARPAQAKPNLRGSSRGLAYREKGDQCLCLMDAVRIHSPGISVTREYWKVHSCSTGVFAA